MTSLSLIPYTYEVSDHVPSKVTEALTMLRVIFRLQSLH